jgi:hypothetical protein
VRWVFTHEYIGPYEAATEVTWCTCKPLPTSGLQHLDDIVGAQLAALAGKEP